MRLVRMYRNSQIRPGYSTPSPPAAPTQTHTHRRQPWSKNTLVPQVRCHPPSGRVNRYCSGSNMQRPRGPGAVCAYIGFHTSRDHKLLLRLVFFPLCSVLPLLCLVPLVAFLPPALLVSPATFSLVAFPFLPADPDGSVARTVSRAPSRTVSPDPSCPIPGCALSLACTRPIPMITVAAI